MRYRFLEFEIDQEAFALRRQGTSISIEPRILDFLVYLIEHRQRMVSTSELLERVWSGAPVQPSAITRCVSLARGVLGRPDAIRTIYGRGYQWVAPVRRYGAGAEGGGPAISSLGLPRLEHEARPRRERSGPRAVPQLGQLGHVGQIGLQADAMPAPGERSAYRPRPTDRMGHARRSRPL